MSRWAEIINLKDAPILAAAAVTQVDDLVTGNVRHFIANPAVARRSDLTIVTPNQPVDPLVRLYGFGKPLES